MADKNAEKFLIKGERIYLRTLSEDNTTEKYCGWLNDASVNKYLETRSATIESVRAYIKERTANSNCVFLGIFYKENNMHIGNIKLEPIDFNKKTATLGLLVGDKEYWGKGIGTEAVKLTVNWAFENLGLREIDLGVIADNAAAIKVYEKAGFNPSNVQMLKSGQMLVHYTTNVPKFPPSTISQQFS